MRKILLITTLLVLAAGPAAIAQTGDRTASPSSDKQGPWPAPVGHRQPHAADVSAPPSSPTLDPEDGNVDRISNICRGCLPQQIDAIRNQAATQ